MMKDREEWQGCMRRKCFGGSGERRVWVVRSTQMSRAGREGLGRGGRCINERARMCLFYGERHS